MSNKNTHHLPGVFNVSLQDRHLALDKGLIQSWAEVVLHQLGAPCPSE